MRLIVLGWIMASGLAWGLCIKNDKKQDLILIEMLKGQTTGMLALEEGELKKAVKAYKEALEKKREMMMILWKTTKEIEFVMKENHILRKRIMKHWENVRDSPSDVHSF